MNFVERSDSVYLFVNEIHLFIKASFVLIPILAALATLAFAMLIFANRSRIRLVVQPVLSAFMVTVMCLVFMFISSKVLQFFVKISLESGNPDYGQEFGQWFLPVGIAVLFWLGCAYMCVAELRGCAKKIKEAK